ncbi:MAG: VWA domain-containing protein [Planctomycetaceae bacterium]
MFPFGEAPLSADDVIELELFHPDEEPLEPVSSTGVIPGTIAAVLLHVWLLATLNNYIRSELDVMAATPVAVTITDVEKEKEKPEKEDDAKYSLANPNDKDHEQHEALNATSTGIAHSKEPQLLSPPDPPMEKIDPELSRNEVFDIPEGLILDESLVVKGTTGNAMIQMEAALDRVTHEIAMNLQERPVLVVWLIDGSASLKEQREILSKRFRRIYGELEALKKAGQIPKRDEPLVSAVVSFGAKTNFHTKLPTASFEEVYEAIQNIKIDESGQENVFTAVTQLMKKWARFYRSRQIMVVTITDESGDDFGMLERAISICRSNRAKAYVLGPAAPFGRRKGYVPYVAPENGQTYRLAVDLGPETARYENVLLPFWFSGPQYEYLSSGYGPYGLSRLVNETGGIYFLTNTLTMKGLTPLGTYDSEKLRPFKPDYSYGTPAEYDRDLLKHPLRLAIVQAAKFSRDNEPEGTPSLDLRVTPANFRQVATQAQQTVARSQLMVDTILQAFPKGIERELDKEESARWRMNFCLTYGRLLALRVRCLEYNSACADLKSNLTPQDVGSKANHWIFKPSRKIQYATSERRAAKTAIALLQRVIDEAPGTPWAVMAERELRHPLGITVVKRFIPPPTPRPRAANNNATPRRRIRLAPDPRKKAPPRKPAPKPKPPRLPRL